MERNGSGKGKRVPPFSLLTLHGNQSIAAYSLGSNQAELVNNIHIPQILTLCINVQYKSQEKRKKKVLNTALFGNLGKKKHIWVPGSYQFIHTAKLATHPSHGEAERRYCSTLGTVLSWEGHQHPSRPLAKCHNLALNQHLAFKRFFHGTAYLITAEGGAS